MLLTLHQTRNTHITHHLGQLTLKLRVDRIDCLSETSYLLIDYKSSRSTLTDWLSDRMSEPQLPLYCLSQQPTVQALAFAQICPDNLQFKGMSAQATAIPGIQRRSTYLTPLFPAGYMISVLLHASHHIRHPRSS